MPKVNEMQTTTPDVEGETLAAQDKGLLPWTRTFPLKADAGDSFYFVKRIDSQDVTIAGFCMGRMWVNGVAYDPSEITQHEFLGPITPELFNTRASDASKVEGFDEWFAREDGGDREQLQRAWTKATEVDASGLLDKVRTAIRAKYDFKRPEYNDGVGEALEAVSDVEFALILSIHQR